MTTQYEPVSPPVALTIAGSDSGGGAGIQADLKTMIGHDIFGASVVTATTAQNTRRVAEVHALPAAHVAAQYEAVVGDFDVRALKTGMLATAETVETVTELLARFRGPIVVDPVMVAATGDRLLSAAAEDAYEALIEVATLVTPNADEAAVLTGEPVETVADAERAGRELVSRGVDAALIKGGHLNGEGGEGDRGDDETDPTVVDTLVVADDKLDAHSEPEVVRFENSRIDTHATHGSGCTLSSAITARLARGERLREAVAVAVREMNEAVRRGYDVGDGPGAVNPTLLDQR